MIRRRWAFFIVLGLISWTLLGSSAMAQDVARVSMNELKAMLDKGEAVVIVDDRPQAEYDRQHIKGAISLPWASDVSEAAKKILPNDKPIITYCDCGPGESDSADVANQLILAGFDKVKTLANGWTAWLEAGYPVEKGRRK